VSHGWVLLRGLVREKRHWLDFPDRLAAATGAEVLCLDLPGVGTERERVVPLTIDGLVDDLRARFLQHPGPRRALFGVSLGGMIALRWAERHPEDFVRVAVCNTSAADVGGTFERISPYALRQMARAIAAWDPHVRETHVLRLISNTDRGHARAPEFAALRADAPVTMTTLVRQLWAASGARAPQQLQVPLTVLASEADRMVSHQNSVRLASRLGAPLHLHPSGGHDLALDDPDWIISKLLAGTP
jgi:alpha-beta hydrolase superfamily lysophospholipase